AARDHRHLRAKAVRDGERVRADVAGAEDQRVAGGHALEAGKQDAAAAVLLLQAPGAHLHGEAAGDRRHRREDRQAAIALTDGLEGDEGGTGGECCVEQLRIGREVLEAEYRLARPRSCVLGRLQLLHLDQQLALPRIADCRAGTRVLLVAEADAEAGARLDDDVRELRDGGGRERNAELAVFYFARYADAHSEMSAGPR